MGHFRKGALAIGIAAMLATSVTPAMAAVSLDARPFGVEGIGRI